MKSLLKSAIEAAPSEVALNLLEIAKLRKQRPPEWARKSQRNMDSWKDRKALSIAEAFQRAKVEKITITDGRTRFTAWNTKENLAGILKRVSPAFSA